MEQASNGTTLIHYIRLCFAFCCVLWVLVAVNHYGNDGSLFDYDYISSNRMIRRLLSEQESDQKWNEIVQDEFSGSKLNEMDVKTSSRISELIRHDKSAINENSAKFHKLLPEYIIAKRQVDIEDAALHELNHKRNKIQHSFEAMQVSTKKEQKGIEAVSESGTEQTDSHKTLEKDLEDEVALIKKQLDAIHHLIHSTTTARDQWLKHSHTLHEQLLSIMQLDKTDRGIESALNRLVHYSSNRECNWQQDRATDCSFESDIDVGMQFDTHYFVVHAPPNAIQLKTIDIQKAHENEDDLCRIKVFIGVNEICSNEHAISHSHTKGNHAVPREICTVNFGKSTTQNDDCGKCNGANIDLKELEQSQLSKERERDALSSFCVILKRHYVYDTGHNPQCKAKGKVELSAATKLAKGHITCSPPKSDLHRKKSERKLKKPNKNKVDTFGDLDEQESFGWRQMVGYWPYCATLLAGIVGIGSIFIVYY
eukprot:748905_1